MFFHFNKNMKHFFTIVAILGVFNAFSQKHAQALNMVQLGNWDDPTLPVHQSIGLVYNSVWGWADADGNEYAVLGSMGKVHFFDVSNPSNITLLSEFNGTQTTLWREFKSYKDRVYAVCDGCSEGLMIFNVSDAAILAAGRTFVGLSSQTTAIVDSEPSTFINSFGVGAGSADTNLKIFYGGSAAQTPIDLGANFPSDTTNTDLYRVCLFSSPSENGVVYYEVLRMNTGDVAAGTLGPGTPGTTLPASTTLLTFHGFRSNAGNAVAVGIAQQRDAVGADAERIGTAHRGLHRIVKHAPRLARDLVRLRNEHVAIGQHVDPARMIETGCKGVDLESGRGLRLLHTADWHLGFSLREHAFLDEQAHLLLEQFVPMVRDARPDAVLLAGDVFHRAIAPVEALALFDEIAGRIVGALGVPMVVIAGNHGHVLSIPAADLNATVDMTYGIQGSADHNHTVTFTPAQLAQLKAGTAVTVTSTTNLSHSHDVGTRCV